MSTDREFDALIRSWFDAAAAPAQPQDLADSVRFATAHRRPRPAWLVRFGGDPMPVAAAFRLGRFASLAVAAAGIVAVTVLGFVLVGQPWRNVGPGPGGSGSPTATASESPSLQPSPSRRSEAHSFSDLPGYTARLVSDRVGWIAAGSNLYRTADSGATWSEIRLPHAQAYVAASIVDADTVFLVYLGDPATIAVTHDGGASWDDVPISGVPGTAGYAWFAMRSATTGTVTFSAEPTSLVFQTGDGGSSWTGPLPPQVVNVGDFLFKTGDADVHGILSYSNGKYDNRPFDERLWVSVDGGVTWVERAFPTDTVTPAGVLKALSGAWIDGSHWLIAIDIEDDRPGGSGFGTSFYESTDDGLTWRYINAIERYQDPIVMLTPTDWVGCGSGSGAFCASTRDGGVTWRERIEPYPYPGEWEEFSFASVDHGWAVIGCSDFNEQPRTGGPFCDGSVESRLVETFDGGHTWTPIG